MVEKKHRALQANADSVTQPYNIMSGDTKASLFMGDVQWARLGVKDTRHQNFVKAVGRHTTDPDRQAGTQAHSTMARTAAKTTE